MQSLTWQGLTTDITPSYIVSKMQQQSDSAFSILVAPTTCNTAPTCATATGFTDLKIKLKQEFKPLSNPWLQPGLTCQRCPAHSPLEPRQHGCAIYRFRLLSHQVKPSNDTNSSYIPYAGLLPQYCTSQERSNEWLQALERCHLRNTTSTSLPITCICITAVILTAMTAAVTMEKQGLATQHTYT